MQDVKKYFMTHFNITSSPICALKTVFSFWLQVQIFLVFEIFNVLKLVACQRVLKQYSKQNLPFSINAFFIKRGLLFYYAILELYCSPRYYTKIVDSPIIQGIEETKTFNCDICIAHQLISVVFYCSYHSLGVQAELRFHRFLGRYFLS